MPPRGRAPREGEGEREDSQEEGIEIDAGLDGILLAAAAPSGVIITLAPYLPGGISASALPRPESPSISRR